MLKFSTINQIYFQFSPMNECWLLVCYIFVVNRMDILVVKSFLFLVSW